MSSNGNQPYWYETFWDDESLEDDEPSQYMMIRVPKQRPSFSSYTRHDDCYYYRTSSGARRSGRPRRPNENIAAEQTSFPPQYDHFPGPQDYQNPRYGRENKDLSRRRVVRLHLLPPQYQDTPLSRNPSNEGRFHSREGSRSTRTNDPVLSSLEETTKFGDHIGLSRPAGDLRREQRESSRSTTKAKSVNEIEVVFEDKKTTAAAGSCPNEYYIRNAAVEEGPSSENSLLSTSLKNKKQDEKPPSSGIDRICGDQFSQTKNDTRNGVIQRKESAAATTTATTHKVEKTAVVVSKKSTEPKEITPPSTILAPEKHHPLRSLVDSKTDEKLNKNAGMTTKETSESSSSTTPPKVARRKPMWRRNAAALSSSNKKRLEKSSHVTESTEGEEGKEASPKKGSSFFNRGLLSSKKKNKNKLSSSELEETPLHTEPEGEDQKDTEKPTALVEVRSTTHHNGSLGGVATSEEMMFLNEFLEFIHDILTGVTFFCFEGSCDDCRKILM